MISCGDDEAIQLRFSNPKNASVLSSDFVLHGRNVPRQNRVVEVPFSLPQRSVPVSSRVAFQTNRRAYPLAINVDSRGIAKSILPVEGFVNIAMTSPVEGTAFGEHFVATDQ